MCFSSYNHYYEKFENGTINDITSEITFDIPNNWIWVRLYNILDIARGGSPRPIQNFLTTNSNGINWIKIGDASKSEKYINSTQEKIIPEGISKSRFVKKGDFILSNSMSFGRPYILNIDGCIHDGWLVFSNVKYSFNNIFLYYLLSSNFVYSQFCSKATGAVVNNLNIDKVKNTLIPLPTLKEQERISNKIELLMKNLEKKDANDSKLYYLKTRFKSKILDKAIQGKLIKQNEDDESAEILINKILDEKRALMKSKEIKKENLSIIYKDSDNQFYEKFDDGKIINITEEIPFDIPNNWSWVRFNNIMDIRDGTHDSPKYHSSGIPLLTSKNLSENGLDLKNINYISLEDSKKINERSKVDDGDILFAMIGSIGNPVVVKKEFEFSIKNMALFKNLYNINKKYIYYVLKIMQEEMKKNASGGVQKFVSLNYLRKFLIPFPPEKEQERIIDKIENTFKYIK